MVRWFYGKRLVSVKLNTRQVCWCLFIHQTFAYQVSRISFSSVNCNGSLDKNWSRVSSPFKFCVQVNFYRRGFKKFSKQYFWLWFYQESKKKTKIVLICFTIIRKCLNFFVKIALDIFVFSENITRKVMSRSNYDDSTVISDKRSFYISKTEIFLLCRKHLIINAYV